MKVEPPDTRNASMESASAAEAVRSQLGKLSTSDQASFAGGNKAVPFGGHCFYPVLSVLGDAHDFSFGLRGMKR